MRIIYKWPMKYDTKLNNHLGYARHLAERDRQSHRRSAIVFGMYHDTEINHFTIEQNNEPGKSATIWQAPLLTWMRCTTLRLSAFPVDRSSTPPCSHGCFRACSSSISFMALSHRHAEFINADADKHPLPPQDSVAVPVTCWPSLPMGYSCRG